MEETKCDGAYRRSFARTFPGIDRRSAHGGAREMVNFRIADDGTLVKRCGYDSVLSMPGTPRAVFEGFLDGEEIFYFLVGNTVFRRDGTSDTGYRKVDTVGSTEGEAAFAPFLGDLYLFDGEEVYVKTKGGFITVEGYIPLYGVEW
ncbi:MAG: hypothetical protein J6B77_09085, partial [Clostridia bacterium]|nr:hypothetical protein [Clostridia bacterium]